ncbi:uncharacterized protein [Henckelia pumila]|uniref:uncharacterized protein n=1 Tax=Henckelia pumila TaxID=405737 RepID=UPI003C6DF370
MAKSGWSMENERIWQNCSPARASTDDAWYLCSFFTYRLWFVLVLSFLERSGGGLASEGATGRSWPAAGHKDLLLTAESKVKRGKQAVGFLEGPGSGFWGPGRSSSASHVISFVRAMKLLRRGCQGFLASVVTSSEPSSRSLSDIDVVREFTDVFLDDVAGIPPVREVEFNVELMPDTVPISKVAFLGHVVSRDGITVDQSKVEAVQNWGTPKNASEIRSFLVPLTSLTKKNAKFVWSSDCQRSFDQLKEALTSAPVLAMPVAHEELVVYTDASKLPLQIEIQRFELEVYSGEKAPSLSALTMQPTLRDRIIDRQPADEQLQRMRQKDEAKGNLLYTVVDGIVQYQGRMWVPNIDQLRTEILTEAHTSPYSIHPENTNMYRDLQSLYWWPGMKRDIGRFVSECSTFQQVKAEHQRSAGFLSPLPIPKWKWENIMIDFVTDGQSERVIKVLKDLLRACVIDFQGSWESRLPSPVHWGKVGERVLVGPEIVQQTADVVTQIRDRMRTTHSRQKSNADTRRRDLEFAVGDHVFLKVSPMNGVMCFGRKGKLNPRYIGSFDILERVGTLAYRLTLAPDLAAVHNVFHVFMLRSYISNPSHILDYKSL